MGVGGAQGARTTQDSVQTTRTREIIPRALGNSRNPPHFQLMRTRGSKVATPCGASVPDTVPALSEAHITPRTVTGKIASAAAVLRQQEFIEWQAALPPPLREDEERDNSYAAFMKQRRVCKEQERWKERRRQQWADRGKIAPVQSRHAVVEHEFMQWEPKQSHLISIDDIGKAFEELKQIGSASREALRRDFEHERDQERKRDAYAAKRAAMGVPVGQQAARRHEQKLAREDARQRRRETKKAAKREQELAQEAAQQQPRKRGRPTDPGTEVRRRARLEQHHDELIATAGPSAAQQERIWFAEGPNKPSIRRTGRSSRRRSEPRGWPRTVLWWRRKAEGFLVGRNPASKVKPDAAFMAVSAARSQAALAKSEAVMATFEATILEDANAAELAMARAEANVTEAVAVAVAARSAEATHQAKRQWERPSSDDEFCDDFKAALAAEGVDNVERVVAALASPKLGKLRAPPSKQTLVPWLTEGQCEGTTYYGERCKVHKNCKHPDAEPLRRGERFCRHHDPKKYTGLRCAALKKHSKGRCRVWSGSPYADAAPLRCGSLYCHHHRVQCAGHTLAGMRCSVTSSCEHEHAEPLRKGGRFCAHHRPLTFDMALGAWGEELDAYEEDRRDDADEKFAMALGAWQAELDAYREGLRDDHSETFEMALNTWDEQCEAEARQAEISSESEHGSCSGSEEYEDEPNPSFTWGGD